MKTTIVQLSEILQQPTRSLHPSDYIADQDFIKLLLIRFRPNDQIRLRSLIERGVFTEEEVEKIAHELQTEILDRPQRLANRVASNLSNIKKVD